LAERAGARVEIADFGDGGSALLFSEYDARRATIRINERKVRNLRGAACERFVSLAIAHELYHHFEAIGAVARLRRRDEREAAAGAFARSLYL
jgi:hypothetical protein